MTKQEMVDIQTISEEGAIISQKSLRELSRYAGEMIDIIINKIILYDDSQKTREELSFWKKILLVKTECLFESFTGEDFRTKALGVVEANGWYITYLYAENTYRWATITETIIYLALKVKDGKMECSEAIEILDDIIRKVVSSE